MNSTENNAANIASDNKVRAAFTITMKLSHSSGYGDEYVVTARHERGGTATFRAIQHRHGDWAVVSGSFSKRTPYPAQKALEGYVSRGHLEPLRNAA